MRVAVLGAGGPAGVSALRALAMAGHELVAVDGNAEHLVWCQRYAETHHIPELTAEAINNLDADVVFPQPDVLVRQLVGMELDAATLLPSRKTVERCQDKAWAGKRWYHEDLRVFPVFKLEEPWPDHLHLARDTLGLPLWLRATRGAGAKGAIKVDSLDQAYHWIRFWQSRSADIEWVAEEFLPGRDFAWSSVWFEGELVTSFCRERLEYLYPHLTPEGLTGTPTIARIVYDDRVNHTAYLAVKAIDPMPHGIYSVDLREDREDYPRPTEINAGRGFTTFGLWSVYGPNFLDLVVCLAAGRVYRGESAAKWNALPEGLTLKRHIDCGHIFSHTLTRKPGLALTQCV